MNTTITQPTMPDPGTVIQQMVSSFGTAGTYAIAIVAAAVALGVILLIAMFAWRNLRKWMSAAKS